MSDVASSAATAAEKPTPKGALAAAVEALPEPNEEHPSDRFETIMEYDPTGKMPIVVVLVWICALVGFAAYMLAYFFPDLALWGKP